MVKVKKIKVNNIFTKSSFKGYSFVINPYTGCTHSCKYCFACFIQQFTKHIGEDWRSFIDIKQWKGKITKNIYDKNILMASITDPYIPEEEKYKKTRFILEKLKDTDCNLTICTRSDLVLRDLDIIKEMRAKVLIAVNMFDENFVSQIKKTPSIERRLNALKKLREAGIYTILSIAPIFPYLTDFKEIIEKTRGFVREYWFENLNLRQPYKNNIMNFIKDNYSELYDKYYNIFVDKDTEYWYNLKNEIIEYCDKEDLRYKIDFRFGQIRLPLIQKP